MNYVSLASDAGGSWKGRVISVGFLLLALPSSSAQEVKQPALAPSVETIITKLVEAEDRVAGLNLAVNYRWTSKYTFQQIEENANPQTVIRYEDDAVAATISSSTRSEIRNDGSSRDETESHRTNIRSDGSRVERTESILSVFNGPRGRGRTVVTGEAGIRNRERSGSTFFGHTLFRLLGVNQSTRASGFLKKTNAQVLDQQDWEGNQVIVLETDPVNSSRRYSYYTKIWVDVERWIMVRRKIFGRQRKHAWGLVQQIDYKGFEQVNEDGVWLPAVVHVELLVNSRRAGDTLFGGAFRV